MQNFKEIRSSLLEYLTPEQRQKFAGIRPTAKVNKITDHFFGVGNDKIERELTPDEHDATTTEDKSEVHKKIEDHLGQKIPKEDYNAGCPPQDGKTLS